MQTNFRLFSFDLVLTLIAVMLVGFLLQSQKTKENSTFNIKVDIGWLVYALSLKTRIHVIVIETQRK